MRNYNKLVIDFFTSTNKKIYSIKFMRKNDQGLFNLNFCMDYSSNNLLLIDVLYKYLHKGTSSQSIGIVADLDHNSMHHEIAFDHNMSKHYCHRPDIHQNPSVFSDH